MENNEPLIITKKHARKCGFCSTGIRQHCEHYGLDFRKFFLEGLPAEQLIRAGNHYMMKMVEVAKQERRGK